MKTESILVWCLSSTHQLSMKGVKVRAEKGDNRNEQVESQKVESAAPSVAKVVGMNHDYV